MKQSFIPFRILAIFGITICVMLLLSQLIRSYILIMLSFFLFSIFSSYIVIIYRRYLYLSILVFIAIPLIIKIVILLSFSDKWLLANSDVIYMMKISEKIISTSHYPFNDIEISTIKPNYLEYPASFLLQSVLSLVLNVSVSTLTLFPITSWVAYFLILLVVLIFIVKFQQNTFDDNCLAYVMGLFMYNFLVLSFFTIFVYSNIIRALIVLYMYMLVKYCAVNEKFKSRCTFLLLNISIILGHSQEPVILFLYLVLLVLVLTVIKLLRWRNISDIIYVNIVQFITLYSVLFLFINMFYAISTHSDVIKFISTTFSNILSKVSLESLIAKEEMARYVLTYLELYILYVTLLLNAITILGILIKYLKECISKRNMLALSVVITSGVFLIINGLVIFYQGFLSDLIFRPLWVFLCSFLPIFMFIRSTNFVKQNIEKSIMHSKMIILLIISLSFFIIGNVIYSKYHILTSDVYIHESLTIEMLSSLKNLISTSNALHSQNLILIIDTPKYPSYEISRALILLTNKTYKTTIYFDPDIPNYYYSYLNGVPKSRRPPEDINVVIIIKSCDYLQLGKVFNEREFYIIGEIKYCLQYYVSIIFSVNTNLSLGFYIITTS